MTIVVDRIREDLNLIQEEAIKLEDGNTISLIDKIQRDLKSLNSNYCIMRVEPVWPVNTDAPKEESKATTEDFKSTKNSTENSLKEPTTSKSRASS